MLHKKFNNISSYINKNYLNDDYRVMTEMSAKLPVASSSLVAATALAFIAEGLYKKTAPETIGVYASNNEEMKLEVGFLAKELSFAHSSVANVCTNNILSDLSVVLDRLYPTIDTSTTSIPSDFSDLFGGVFGVDVLASIKDNNYHCGMLFTSMLKYYSELSISVSNDGTQIYIEKE